MRWNMQKGVIALDYQVLKGEIARLKKIRGYTNAYIAQKANLVQSTFEAFYCGVRETKNTADKIYEFIKKETGKDLR